MRTWILVVTASLGLMSSAALAQGVNDPSTPNAGRIIVVPAPSEPRSTATPNRPPANTDVPLGVRRDPNYNYRNYRRDGRGR